MGPVRVWPRTVALACAFACGEAHEAAAPIDPDALEAVAQDAGTAADDADSLAPYVLCDGSDDVRFAVTSSGGGLQNPAIAFTQPYGSSFLYITGKCEYLAGEDLAGGGLVMGTLDATQASALEDSLELARLSALRAERQPGCDDGGHTVVATQLGYGYVGCGYDDPPDALRRIMQKARQAQAELAAGTPRTDDLQVGGFVAAETDANNFHPWPIELDLTTIALPPWREQTPYPEMLPVLTVSGADADALRALRMTEPERGLFRDARFVERDGVYYELYILDVVPERFTTAIAAFERRPR